MNQISSININIIEKAAQYFARMNSDDLTDAEILEITQWLEASQEHADAFDKAQITWENALELAPSPVEVVSPSAANDNIRIPWSSLIAAGLLITIGWPIYGLYSNGSPKTYQTAELQMQQVTLQDGSQIHLNQNTTLEVRIGAKNRTIKLLRGEFAVNVAHNEKAPFKTIIGENAIWDVGTRFNVNANGEKLVVSVQEGKVSYSPASAKSGGREIVSAGEQLTISKNNEIKVTNANIEDAFAWEHPKTSNQPNVMSGKFASNNVAKPDQTSHQPHQFRFENTNIAAASAQISKQFGVKIEVSPTIASIKVSAIINAENAQEAVSEISKFTNTKFEYIDGGYYISK